MRDEMSNINKSSFSTTLQQQLQLLHHERVRSPAACPKNSDHSSAFFPLAEEASPAAPAASSSSFGAPASVKGVLEQYFDLPKLFSVYTRR
mmetsp:Transcript_28511/g.72310  ORF Transcript_28511/g.72310 Transcript_28511/m.72310 type:complete len:91 (-) Transcript_28511:16-288(-)